MASLPRSTKLLYGCVVAVYLLAFPYHPKLRSPNELCRLWQSRSLVEYGTIDINGALRDYGYVGDLSVKDGRYFPSKAPLLSFAAAPIYAVLKWFGGADRWAVPEVPQVFWSRLILTILPTLVMLFFLRRFLATYFRPETTDLVVVTYALGSLALSYSLAFIGHQTTAVLLFAAFYALWRMHRGEWSHWGYLAAGAFAGAAVANEYTAALPVLSLAFYDVHAQLGHKQKSMSSRLMSVVRGAGLTLVGALPFLVGLMLYHQEAFGHPLVSGYKYLNDPGYQEWHVGGFLGIRFPSPTAFFLSFFSPLRGLMTISPFLLLSIPGTWLLWRQTRGENPRFPSSLLWLTLVQLLGYTYFTSSFAYESWGWTTGPRHLTPLVPFLLVPVALAIDWAMDLASPRRSVAVGVTVGLCAASIWITGTIVMVNYIPDSLSTSLFGAVVPLMREGYFSPSVLLFAGMPNPLSGAMVWVGVLAAGVLAWWTGARMLEGKWPAVAGASLAVVLLALAPLYLATRHDEADRAAVAHLRNTWLAPPKADVPFWPSR